MRTLAAAAAAAAAAAPLVVAVTVLLTLVFLVIIGVVLARVKTHRLLPCEKAPYAQRVVM